MIIQKCPKKGERFHQIRFELMAKQMKIEILVYQAESLVDGSAF